MKHDYDNAAAELMRVIALDPKNESAYYQLGLIYLSQKQSGEGGGPIHAAAENQSQQRPWAMPDWRTPWRTSIAIPEALAEYKRVADIDSLYQGVNYNIGVIEARLNQYDDAIASLLKQRQAADDPDNENLLAAVYEAKGMKKQADEARQKAAEFQGGR